MSNFPNQPLLPSRWRTSIMIGMWGLVLLFIQSFQASWSLQADGVSVFTAEYNLKLARIYATIKFINWPDDSDSSKPFRISVLAPDPFAGGLTKLDGRKIRERPIQTQVIRSASEFNGCHLLFIPSGSDAALVAEIRKKIAGSPILIWRDAPDPNNSIPYACSFVRQGDNLIIETDPAELQRVGLSPDGRLMSLNLVRLIKSTQ